MICPNCNKELNITTGFCPYCGSSLNTTPINNSINTNQTLNTQPTLNQMPINQQSNNSNNYQQSQGFNQNPSQTPKKKNLVFIILAVIVIAVIVIMSVTKKVNKTIDRKKSKESDLFDIYEIVEVPEEKTEGFNIYPYKNYEYIGTMAADLDHNYVAVPITGWRIKIAVPLTQRIKYNFKKLSVNDYYFSADIICDFEKKYDNLDYYKKITSKKNTSYIVYRNKNSNTVDVTACYEKLNNKVSFEDVKLNIEFSSSKEQINQLQSNGTFLELAEVYNLDVSDVIKQMKIAGEEIGIYADEEKIEEKDITPTVDPKTNLSYTEKGAFLMHINSKWYNFGEGLIVSGKINRGTVKVGDKVQVVGLDKKLVETKVAKIKKGRDNEEVKSAKMGESVSIILDKLTGKDVETGQVIAKKNSITASKSLEAELYINTKDEKGLESPLTKTDYEMSLFHNDSIYKVKLKLPEGKTALVPGETIKVTIEAQQAIPIEVNSEFSLQFRYISIGKGKITKIN